MLHRAALIGMPALIAAALVAVPAPAQARDGEHYTVEFVNADFCGLLSVRVVEDGDLHWIGRPADGDAQSFTVWSQGTVTVTSLTNGRVVSMAWHKADRDVRVSDNGDGTRTLSAMNSRLETWVGPDGEVLKNRGVHFWELVVSDGGTPGDPFDDFWVEELGFREVGNWDLSSNLCEQMIAWLG